MQPVAASREGSRKAAVTIGDFDVRDIWVIVRDPGCVPERKLPMLGEHGLRDFLRELVECRPAETDITIIRVDADGVDADCGREWLSIFDRRWWKKHGKFPPRTDFRKPRPSR
jgi:hypothetical protein